MTAPVEDLSEQHHNLTFLKDYEEKKIKSPRETLKENQQTPGILEDTDKPKHWEEGKEKFKGEVRGGWGGNRTCVENRHWKKQQC